MFYYKTQKPPHCGGLFIVARGLQIREIGISRVMIGKYERGEAIPSIDAAKKIADALGVTLDYLVGETSQVSFDKRTVDRIKDLEELEESKKQTLYDLIDTYIRDFKTRKTFSNL